MKNIKRSSMISLAFIITATVLRTLAGVFAFDEKVEYFDHGSIFYIGSIALLIASIVLAVCTAFRSKSEVAFCKSSNKNYEISAFFVGVTLLIYTVYEVYSLFKGNFGIWGVLASALSLLSAVYFLRTFLSGDRSDSTYIINGFAVVFWCAVVLAVNYFEIRTTLNNPLKLALQLAMLATMVELLFEFRVKLGKDKIALHYVACVTMSAFCMFASLPTILIFALGKTSEMLYLMPAIVALALAVYGLFVCLRFSNESTAEEAAPEQAQAQAETSEDDPKETE